MQPVKRRHLTTKGGPNPMCFRGNSVYFGGSLVVSNSRNTFSQIAILRLATPPKGLVAWE